MITINLDEDGARINIEKDGVRFQKYLTTKSLQSCILKNYCTDSGLLPYGTVAFKQTTSRKMVAMVQEAGIREVKFEDGAVISSFKIPVPPLLWIFDLTHKNMSTRTYVFALETKSIIPDSKIYRAPFSNVYNEGNICWGDSSFLNAPFKTLIGLSSLPDIFFSRPFNVDLDSFGCLELFKRYNDKKEFDTTDLVLKTTFKEIWQNED